MSERFIDRLKQQVQGRREKWEPRKVTPKQIKDQIDGRRGVDMESGLRQHPPTDGVVEQKDVSATRINNKKKRGRRGK